MTSVCPCVPSAVPHPDDVTILFLDYDVILFDDVNPLGYCDVTVSLCPWRRTVCFLLLTRVFFLVPTCCHSKAFIIISLCKALFIYNLFGSFCYSVLLTLGTFLFNVNQMLMACCCLYTCVSYVTSCCDAVKNIIKVV